MWQEMGTDSHQDKMQTQSLQTHGRWHASCFFSEPTLCGAHSGFPKVLVELSQK